MKRRDFIKALPLLTATSLVLTQVYGKGNPKPKHLIALGTAACRLATHHFDQLSFDSITGINTEQERLLNQKGTFIDFQPPENLYEQIEHLKVPKKEYLPVLPLDPMIHKHLESLEGELVFLAGLGGVTATLLFQSIGCHYSNSNQSLEWLAMMPFEFEGSWRSKNARQAVQVLADQRREPTLIYLEEIRTRYGNLSIRSAFQKADEWVLSELNEV